MDAAYPRRVVVTGLGLVTPLGAEVKVNWRRALDGVEGTRALEVGDVPANEREAFTRRTGAAARRSGRGSRTTRTTVSVGVRTDGWRRSLGSGGARRRRR